MDKVTQEELFTLKLLKSELEKASLKLEASNMNFKYFVMSLYRKYNLSDLDNISEANGDILKATQEEIKKE